MRCAPAPASTACRSSLSSPPRPYYWDNVVGGPGAFVIAAESYETFADAVLKKLVIEIAGGREPGRAPRSASSGVR